jgi:hypothetical protein
MLPMLRMRRLETGRLREWPKIKKEGQDSNLTHPEAYTCGLLHHYPALSVV